MEKVLISSSVFRRNNSRRSLRGVLKFKSRGSLGVIGAEASAAERGMVLNIDIGARCGGGFLDRALRLLGAVLAAVTCGVLLDLRVDEETSSSKPPVKSPAASLLATSASTSTVVVLYS